MDAAPKLRIARPNDNPQARTSRRSCANSGARERLLVFYVPEMAEWQDIVDRMTMMGFAPVPRINPDWVASGKPFEDPDGYRVVLDCATCLTGEE